MLLPLPSQVQRVYCGPFMTSLDMAGISLTLLRATAEQLQLLDAATAAPGWPAAPAVYTPGKVPAALPASSASSAVAAGAAAAGAAGSAQGAAVAAAVQAAAQALVAAAEELDVLDAKTGVRACWAAGA